jgi:hypothetical protein
MASAESPQSPGAGELQFDRAEFATTPPGSVACTVCKQPIPDVYYELHGNLLCAPCMRKVDSGFVGGSRFLRFTKAAYFGLLAAIGGTIIIYLVREMTGLGAIISILVGYMVGSAVKQGTGYRGGRIYQVLAVFLTYSALSWSYLPRIYKAFEAAAKEPAARAGVVPEAKAGGLEEARPGVPSPEASPAAGEDVREVKKEAAGPVAAPARNVDPKPIGELNPLLALIVFGCLVVVILAYSYVVPIDHIVSQLPQGVIGLAILFFGLQLAWRLTRKVSLDFRGPFRVGGKGPSLPGVSAHA